MSSNMTSKRIAPSITRKSFNCPVCGTLADQTWFGAHARRVDNNGVPKLMAAKELKKRHDAHVQETIDDNVAASRQPSLRRNDDGIYCYDELANIHVSRCDSCSEVTIWLHDTVFYPPTHHEFEPNPDLSDNVKADFKKAREIVGFSPRGAAALLRVCVQNLCIHLKKPGKNLNEAIGSLVADGLPKNIQKALDLVRVTGDKAVPPGELDLKDDRATAEKLFGLINMIAYDQITQPKDVKAMYDNLPEGAKKQIKKRDGNEPQDTKS